MIDHHIFRAYDIRGKAHSQITEDACLSIGKAFGSTLRELYKKDHPTIAVGRDARTHSPQFEEAVVQGLLSSGCHCLRIGQTPSPVNYFTICHQHLDGGVQVTASHNPPEDNGMKLQLREAEAFSEDRLQELRKRIEVQDFLTGEGIQEEIDALTPYLSQLHTLFGLVGKNQHIVIDAGNGVAGPAYLQGIEQSGAEVHGLYIDPDGTFPNHPADPSKYDTLTDLQQTILEQSADIGFAFDGDGDRLGLVDETGTIRTADEILLLLAKDYLRRHQGKSVVCTVSNSGLLLTEIPQWGGKPVMTTVGHSFVEHAMREHQAQIGGEQSGHFFCAEDYYGFDDALVAALRLLAILHESNKPLSKLCDAFPPVFQEPEIRPNCPDEEKTRIVQEITQHFAEHYPINDLDGVRIDFGDGAWAGIRQSNTSPKLSICMEARSKEKLMAIKDIVLQHVSTYPEIELSL